MQTVGLKGARWSNLDHHCFWSKSLVVTSAIPAIERYL